MQYLVVSAYGTEFEYAQGVADVATGRAMDAAVTQMAYSMTKVFTAVAVLQLVEAGRVDLDDPIGRWVPQPYGDGITVRHLLAHTAGIPNPLPLRWVHPVSVHAAVDEPAELVKVLKRHARPAAAPGARFRYANIGYWLLGAMVEQVSGVSFTAFTEANVLAPLGVAPRKLGFAVLDDARHAKGYLRRHSLLDVFKGVLLDSTLVGAYEGRWLHLRSHYLNGPAVGGLVGTPRGVAALLRDQLRPRSVLLGDAARALLYEVQRSNGGATVPMTLGWHRGGTAVDPIYFKEGGGGGFHCLMRLYPRAGIATLIMANASGVDVHGALDTLDPSSFPVWFRSWRAR